MPRNATKKGIRYYELKRTSVNRNFRIFPPSLPQARILRSSPAGERNYEGIGATLSLSVYLSFSRLSLSIYLSIFLSSLSLCREDRVIGGDSKLSLRGDTPWPFLPPSWLFTTLVTFFVARRNTGIKINFLGLSSSTSSKVFVSFRGERASLFDSALLDFARFRGDKEKRKERRGGRGFDRCNFVVAGGSLLAPLWEKVREGSWESREEGFNLIPLT